jgi:hypothetical protein
MFLCSEMNCPQNVFLENPVFGMRSFGNHVRSIKIRSRMSIPFIRQKL